MPQRGREHVLVGAQKHAGKSPSVKTIYQKIITNTKGIEHFHVQKHKTKEWPSGSTRGSRTSFAVGGHVLHDGSMLFVICPSFTLSLLSTFSSRIGCWTQSHCVTNPIRDDQNSDNTTSLPLFSDGGRRQGARKYCRLCPTSTPGSAGGTHHLNEVLVSVKNMNLRSAGFYSNQQMWRGRRGASALSSPNPQEFEESL